MPTKTLIAAMISSLCLLTACQPFNYKQNCWQQYKQKGMCGNCVQHHCEDICRTCHGNEQQCLNCWACIAKDGCMESSGQCGTMK